MILEGHPRGLNPCVVFPVCDQTGFFVAQKREHLLPFDLRVGRDAVDLEVAIVQLMESAAALAWLTTSGGKET